jgi:dTDP-4-amino-4,6-dideoxygalactose transaminase
VRICLSDPRAGYLAYRVEIDAAIAHVLKGGEYILGPEVDAFEEEFARFLGVQTVISTGNGTDAIELALRGLNIGRGDLVITTSNTAVATVAAIELSDASALLVEVDERTLTMSPEHFEQALRDHKGRGIKAVIPVHLFGQPADLPAISEIAHRHGVMLIEDAAQAHGASIDGRQLGAWGEAAAFSFYPTKNLGALGDGGAVVTNDEALAARLRELRTYGWKERHVSARPGMNTRLDSLQAAVLRVKLRHLEAENARRRELADRYDRSLGDLPLNLPARLPEYRHVFHQYVIRSSSRDDLREHLRKEGVGTSVLYPIPIHLQPGYRGRIATASELPVTERAVRELLCLPVHPWLRDEEVDEIACIVRSFFSR